MQLDELIGTDTPCKGQYDVFDERLEHYFDTSRRRLVRVEISDRYPNLHEARVTCSECPFLVQCRRLGKGEDSGIWGGWVAPYTR